MRGRGRWVSFACVVVRKDGRKRFSLGSLLLSRCICKIWHVRMSRLTCGVQHTHFLGQRATAPAGSRSNFTRHQTLLGISSGVPHLSRSNTRHLLHLSRGSAAFGRTLMLLETNKTNTDKPHQCHCHVCTTAASRGVGAATPPPTRWQVSGNLKPAAHWHFEPLGAAAGLNGSPSWTHWQAESRRGYIWSCG